MKYKMIETHGEKMKVAISVVEKMNGELANGITLTLENPKYSEYSMDIALKDDVNPIDALNNFSQQQADLFFQHYFAGVITDD